MSGQPFNAELPPEYPVVLPDDANETVSISVEEAKRVYGERKSLLWAARRVLRGEGTKELREVVARCEGRP